MKNEETKHIKKVLVVDDSWVARQFVIRLLKNISNIEIIEASGGNEALEKIKNISPSCIILDLLMNDIDGYDVLAEMNSLGVKIPVIVLSADIQVTTKNKCMKLGAFSFLNKPPVEEDLLDIVKKALI